MMEKRFDIIEHTADIGIIAYGESLEEALANAAYAMFSLIADLDNIEETVETDVEATAEDEESLTVRWLNELLYLFDVKGIIFKKFDISELSPNRLKAKAYGEPLDPSRHSLKSGVKAATYHMLKIEKNREFKIQVIFDV
jgi:SHS2 domain-containing protein